MEFDDDEKEHEKKIEKLSKAITEAILQSKDVRKALLELQKEDMVGGKSFIMLMMRVDGLADLVKMMQDSRVKGRRGKRSEKSNAQFIDGKKLSPSEVEFYEYLAKKFDEDEWLNKNGLIFD